MRQLVLSLAIIAHLAGPGQAQGANEAADIRGVISDQIEAFKSDDFNQAFRFAGPGIQGMFRTPENFGAMVRGGYPMVWRPQELRFGELREEAGVLWQRIIVRDSEGRAHVLDYRMGQYEDGWRIDGVQMVRAPEVAA